MFTARYALNVYVYNSGYSWPLKGAVSWLKSLDVGLSPRRPEFDPSTVHVRLAVDIVSL